MSYEVAIWKTDKTLTPAAAKAIYRALGAASPLERTPALRAFHRDLMKRFPPLDEENDDECPWASSLEVGARFVVAPMSASWVGDALPVIQALAAKHGLDVYDPQQNKVLTTATATATKPKPNARLKPEAAQRSLNLALTAPMKKLGFIADDGVFVRAQKDRTEELTLRYRGGASVVLELAIRFAAVSAIVDPILAPWPRVFGRGAAIASGVVYIQHDLSGKYRSFGDFEVCHQECLEKSIKAVPRVVKKEALPLFAALDTLTKVDAFLNGPKKHDWRPRAHDWAEYPIAALAVAKLVKRKDREALINEYSGRRAKSADLNRAWPALLNAIR